MSKRLIRLFFWVFLLASGIRAEALSHLWLLAVNSNESDSVLNEIDQCRVMTTESK